MRAACGMRCISLPPLPITIARRQLTLCSLGPRRAPMPQACGICRGLRAPGRCAGARRDGLLLHADAGWRRYSKHASPLQVKQLVGDTQLSREEVLAYLNWWSSLDADVRADLQSTRLEAERAAEERRMIEMEQRKLAAAEATARNRTFQGGAHAPPACNAQCLAQNTPVPPRRSTAHAWL